MAAPEPSASANPILLPPRLPIAQLETLRSKMTQILESIQVLQRSIEMGGQNVMLPWPELLSKYNILLSQAHTLTMALVPPQQQQQQSASQPSQQPKLPGSGGGLGVSPFEKIAVHPSAGMTDAQLDNDLIPLLRNQQTTDVLKLENETVRHLAEHMTTKGSIGVLFPPSTAGPTSQVASGLGGRGRTQPKKTEYEDVLQECEQIRIEHDLRVERAVRAVAMLREQYDWKARVEVDQEEPEELEWDPRSQAVQPPVAVDAGPGVGGMDVSMSMDLGMGMGMGMGAGEMMGVESESTPGGHSDGSSVADEEELEEALRIGVDQSPGPSQAGTPLPSNGVPMVE